MVDRLTDSELAAFAMEATPSDPFADDAVPFGAEVSSGAQLLPEWYMPVPQTGASSRTPQRTFAVGLIIVALLAINGAGLCITYGLPEIAW